MKLTDVFYLFRQTFKRNVEYSGELLGNRPYNRIIIRSLFIQVSTVTRALFIGIHYRALSLATDIPLRYTVRGTHFVIHYRETMATAAANKNDHNTLYIMQENLRAQSLYRLVDGCRLNVSVVWRRSVWTARKREQVPITVSWTTPPRVITLRMF